MRWNMVIGAIAVAAFTSSSHAQFEYNSWSRNLDAWLFVDDITQYAEDTQSDSEAQIGVWNEQVTADAYLRPTKWALLTPAMNSVLSPTEILFDGTIEMSFEGVHDSSGQRGDADGRARLTCQFSVAEPTDVLFWCNIDAGGNSISSVYFSGPGVSYELEDWAQIEPTPITLQPGMYDLYAEVTLISPFATVNGELIESDLSASCGIQVVSPPGCEADLTTQGAGVGDSDYGVPDGIVGGADINYFVNAWVVGDLAIADVTTTGAAIGDPGYGVPDGAITGADIQYYVNLWVAGCP